MEGGKGVVGSSGWSGAGTGDTGFLLPGLSRSKAILSRGWQSLAGGRKFTARGGHATRGVGCLTRVSREACASVP